MSKLEKMLAIGLIGTMIYSGCKKSDSSSLYREYKSSQGKEQTKEEMEKSLVNSLEKYFNSSKSRKLNDYWGCMHEDMKNRLYGMKSGSFEYQIKFTEWVYGNPVLEKINKIEFSEENTLGNINVQYSHTFPSVGRRFRYSDASFLFRKKGEKWLLLGDPAFRDMELIENMKPKNLPIIKDYPN